MSSSLPPEILDLIVHHLHDEPTPLSTCCLVSNSWVSRTRRHLFARVELHSPGPSLESWMKAFPDPSNSPAHYTRSLHLQFFGARAVAVSDAFPWIRSFSHIVDLQVTVGKRRIPFAQLYGLSPALKSLHLFGPIAPLSEVLDFICSFPLLEDLSLRFPRLPYQENTDGWDAPPISPKFTGSLLLIGSDDRITRKLLDLPGGLHFSKVSVTRLFGERDLTKELVSMCSSTLESLCVDIYPNIHMYGMPPSLDLSKATKLKDVEFRLCELKVKRINAAVPTATSTNLQQITVSFPDIYFVELLPSLLDEGTRTEWQDLDHLLVQLWTTRSIRPVFTNKKMEGENFIGVVTQNLLPELTGRGIVGVVRTL